MIFNAFYCGSGLWDARPWLEGTKSDIGGIAIMEKKANILPVYVENVYCGAANILKQELLSLGGELSVHKYAVNCKVEYGDVLILATYKQYRLLYRKLAMQHWKLKDLGQELKLIINNILLAQKENTQILDASSYQDFKILGKKFSPSTDFPKDMASLPLLEATSFTEQILFLNRSDFSDMKILGQYILALQSKGYGVLLESTEAEAPWVTSFLHPNYLAIS